MMNVLNMRTRESRAMLGCFEVSQSATGQEVFNAWQYSAVVRSGCSWKILPSLLKASEMKRSATRPAKMSLVNLVKNLTKVDPSKPATRRAMAKVQRPIQNLQ